MCGACDSGAEEAAHHRCDAERAADHLVMERAQRLAELGGGLVALLGIARQRARDDVGEAGGKVAAELLDGRYPSGAHHLLQLFRILALEGATVGEDLVEDHGGAPEIDARRERRAIELLGSEVGQLSPQGPAVVLVAQRPHLGDAEIAELDLAEPRDEEVRGRDVAVDDVQVQAGGAARLVRVAERVADAPPDEEREGHGQEDLPLPAASEDEAQIAAVDVLHRDVDGLADEAGLQHLDDVGMLEQSRDVGFDGEEVHGFRIGGELGSEALERDDLADERSLGDARLVHLGHPAAAEKLQDLEAPEPRRGPTGLAHAGPVSGTRKASGPAARTESGVASELDTVAESTTVPCTGEGSALT